MKTKLTKQSLENLSLADRIGLNKGFDKRGEFFTVWVERNGIRAFLHTTDQILIFNNIVSANSFCQKLKPNFVIN